jgi:hypothetical protein
MKVNDLYRSKKSLAAADLNGKAVRVTIEDVTSQKFEEGEKAILHFVGKEKTLVLNRINSYAIINAVGDDESDSWIGWSIVLYTTKVPFQGKMVDAIRVDDRPGSTKPPATPQKRATAAPTTPQDVFDEHVDLPSDDDIPF